jgi:hypothetical protein
MDNTLRPFTESKVCQSAVKAGGTSACMFCRLRMDWQNNAAGTVYTNPRDTICPLRFKLGEVPAIKTLAKTPPAPTNQKPAVTAAKAVSFFQAMLLSPRVAPEVEAARQAICEGCDKRGTDGKTSWCNVCGCGVGADVRSILNLAHYSENLPKWGCKHPLRGYTDPQDKKLGWPLPTSPAPSNTI